MKSAKMRGWEAHAEARHVPTESGGQEEALGLLSRFGELHISPPLCEPSVKSQSSHPKKNSAEPLLLIKGLENLHRAFNSCFTSDQMKDAGLVSVHTHSQEKRTGAAELPRNTNPH